MIQDLYKDADYCISEIWETRKLWSDEKLFTKQRAEDMNKALCLMYLYCPEKVKSMVEATMMELEIREKFIRG